MDMKTKARHTLIKGWDQLKLKKAIVLIAGVGAIGSQTAVTLARIGIGKIIAVDSDILEEHNIFNQIYSKLQIGKNKIQALKERIEEISDLEFIGLRSMIQDVFLEELNPDVLLGCFDNAGARFYLNYIAVKMKKPYIDAGIEGYAGNVRTILPFKNPCLQCWPSMIKEDEIKPGCSEDPIPSTYFTASYASNLQVMQLVHILSEKQNHPLICFDLEKGITQPIELKRNKGCGLCGKMK